MVGIFVGVVGVFIILMADEIFWRLRLLKGEFTREIIHILTGTFIAFWPLMMSFKAVQVLAVIMLGVVALSRRYHIFQSIHAVKRLTYGEFFFPLSILIMASLTESKAIFAAAILHLSLADGLAALVGTYFGKKNSYKVFGQTKSLYGTAAFLASSLCIMVAALTSDVTAFANVSVWLVIWLPLLTTLTESVAVFGTDDLLVPLLVGGILQVMQR